MILLNALMKIYETDNISEAVTKAIVEIVTEGKSKKKCKTLFPYVGKKPPRIAREVLDEKEVYSHYIKAKVAIKKGDFIELQKHVEECNKIIECTSHSGGTLLHIAAAEGTPEMIEYLVRNHSKLDRIENEWTPLCYAVTNNRIENVKKLLELGAELNSKESERTPLIYAMSNNNPQIAKLLIDGGIDLTVQYSTRDDIWWDALSYAKYYGCHEIHQMILDKMKADGIDYDSIKPLTDDDFEDDVALEDYYEEHLGKIAIQYDEIDIQKKIYDGKIKLISEVDLYIDVIMPNKDRNYITLVTVGMSEVPMAETAEGQKFAELIMKLPADWDVSENALSDLTKNWPFRMMLKTAHLGHKFKGYVDETTVIPSGNPNDAILYFNGDTELSSVMLCRSEDISPLKVDDEMTIDFFTLIPITEKEAELVKTIGSETLKKRLPKGEIVDLERNYIA